MQQEKGLPLKKTEYLIGIDPEKQRKSEKEVNKKDKSSDSEPSDKG